MLPGRINLRTLLFFLACLNATGVVSQPRSTSVGICYRPVFPVAFLGTGEDRTVNEGVNYTLGLDRGFSGGMVVRRGWTSSLSLEAGINYTKRSYTYSITDSSQSFMDRFRLVGYEVPVSLLAFVQLGENIFMNASLGAGIDAIASSVATKTGYYEQVAIKRHTFNPSLNANLGWEFRSRASGTFYLGATYHRPFGEICVNSVLYGTGNDERVFNNLISGSYLTADIRYYFKNETDKVRPKTNRRKKMTFSGS